MEYESTAESTAELYESTSDEMLRFLPGFLKADSLRFYNDHVKFGATSYAGSELMLQTKFNSKARQNRLELRRQALQFETFARNGTSAEEALVKLSSEIGRLFSQTSQSWRSNARTSK